MILRRGLRASNCSTNQPASVAGIRGRQKASQWWQETVHWAEDSYLWVREPGEVRVQVELDAFGSPRQRDPSDQEDQEHDIGEGRGDVYNLPRRRETRMKKGAQKWATWQKPVCHWAKGFPEQPGEVNPEHRLGSCLLSRHHPLKGWIFQWICWVPTMVLDITDFQTYWTKTHRK